MERVITSSMRSKMNRSYQLSVPILYLIREVMFCDVEHGVRLHGKGDTPIDRFNLAAHLVVKELRL